MKSSKVGRGGLGQVPVPIRGRAHIQQLINAAEQGGFRIGFRQSGKRCLGCSCGNRITTMACQGEPPEGRVTKFRI